MKGGSTRKWREFQQGYGDSIRIWGYSTRIRREGLK